MRVTISSYDLIASALVHSHVKINIDFIFPLRKLEHVSVLISYTCCQKSSQLLLHSQQFIFTSDSWEGLRRLLLRDPLI